MSQGATHAVAPFFFGGGAGPVVSESKTSENRLSAVERAAEALRLRKRGLTYEQIADQLGYAGPSGAYRAIHQALHKTLQEPADDVRALEVTRLDALLDALWDAALSGKWLAVDRVLKIMERRAALLGLDAPQKVDITHRVRELAEAQGLDPDEAVRSAEAILKASR